MHAPSPSPRPRLPRRLLRAFGLLCLLSALAVLALPYAARHFIGPERLRSLAEETLTEALGRRVTISGDVVFSLTPWPALRMGPVAVADAPEFGDKPIVEADRLETTIRLLPLWSRIVAPGSVRVRGLHLHLRRDASGHANWEHLDRPKAKAAAGAPDWSIAPEPRDVLFENARADYHDATTGRTLAVSDIRLATGVGQPFAFSLDFTANDAASEASLACRINGQASMDASGGRLALHRTRVDALLTRERPLVPGGASLARARLLTDLDYEAGTWTLSHIDLRLLATRLSGALRITGLPDAPKAKASLQLTAPSDGHWRELLGLSPASGSLVAASRPDTGREPQPPGGEAVLTQATATEPGRIQVGMDLTADATGLDVSSLRLTLPHGEATASGVWKWGAKPVLDAALTLADVDLAALPLPEGRASWPWPLPWLSGLAADVRVDLRHCALGSLAVPDAHATVSAKDGRLRLYPVSAVLPGGIVALDARLHPNPDRTPPGLVVEARAALEPGPATSARGLKGPTTLELKGNLDADGAKGAFTLRSDNPQAAATLLGQAADLPDTALNVRGSFAATPGIGHVLSTVALTGLEAGYGGTVLRGQAAWDVKIPDKLTFDCGLEALDLDLLPPLPFAGGDGGMLRAEGKVRLGRVAGHGLEARNLELGLAYDHKRLEAVVTGGELWGGRLGGKGSFDTASGRLAAALHLSGAEASRLPTAGGALGLSGQTTLAAVLETAGWSKGRPVGLGITLEADAPQLALKSSGKRTSLLTAPKATLTLKSREGGDTAAGLDLEANLALAVATAPGLREVRLKATGPLRLDQALRPREPSKFGLEASGLARSAGGAVKDLQISAHGPLLLDWSGGMTLGEMTVNAGGLAATAKCWRKTGETGPMSFSLDAGTTSPRRVLEAWGVTVPASVPADKLTRIALSASGSVGEAALDVKQLRVRLDDTTITGQGRMPQFDPKRGRWDLHLDRLDLDAYFPQPAAGAPKPAAAPAKPYELDLLRQLAMEIHLDAGWIKRGNVAFDAAGIMANARGGLFTFRLESQRFYGGRFYAEVRGDARNAVLGAMVELKLESFECARFLKDWADGDTLAAGAATFILAARTSGLTETELRGHIAGNASLQITRGDLKVKSRPAKAGSPPSEDRIPFDIFSSSWTSTGGVARTDDFRIDGPRMRVTGNGFVDLRDESINLSVLAHLKEGSEVPATIIGPLDNPKLTIDRSRIFGDILYNILQGIVSIPGKAVSRILMLR